jgi:DNA repair protein RadC
MVRERTLSLPREAVHLSTDLAAIASERIGKLPVEHCIAICVNGANRVTAVVELSKGGMQGCGMRIVDVLRTVLVTQPVACRDRMIATASRRLEDRDLAHNHPSGDVKASSQDVEFTRELKKAAAIVGLPLLDHIVVVADGSFSSVPGAT